MDFDLKKITASFKKIQSQILHPVKSVVGIDIGSSAIKIVQVKKEAGRAVLETYGSIALGSYAGKEVGEVTNLPPEKIAEALAVVLKESGATTREASVAVSSTLGLIVLVELPSAVRPSEFNSVVPTEARKFIPVPISEVVLDWFVVPKRETVYEEEGEEAKTEEEMGPTEVLVVAIPKDSLARLQGVSENAGLLNVEYEHEIFSHIRSNLTHEISPVLVLDCGASKTRLAIIERGIVKVFHSINRGGGDITAALVRGLGLAWQKAEETKKTEGLMSKDKNIVDSILLGVDYILGETSNVVFNFQKKYNKNITKVILSGGGASLPGFLEKTQEVLRIETVLSSAFNKTESPAFLAKTLEKSSPEFSVAIGLALKKLV